MGQLTYAADYVQLPADSTGKRTGFLKWDTGAGNLLYLATSIPIDTTGNTLITSLAADAETSANAVSEAAHLFQYNGTTWDRVRGDTTNGIDVDVTRVTGTVTVDSELAAAAALSDTFANPTTAPVGAFLMGYDYNNSDWDRVIVHSQNDGQISTTKKGVYTSSALWSRDQANGVVDYLNQTDHSLQVLRYKAAQPGSTLASVTNTSSVDIYGAGSVCVKVSGTFVATVNFEYSVGGTSQFVTCRLYDINGKYIGTTVPSGTGTYFIYPDGGASTLRANMTARTSGTFSWDSYSLHAAGRPMHIGLVDHDGVDDASPPLKIGGVYKAAGSTVSNGDRTEVLTDNKGNLRVSLISDSAVTPIDSATPSDGMLNSKNALYTIPFLMVYNQLSTGWDRLKTNRINPGSTGTRTSVAQAATDTLLLAANTGRIRASIVNDSPNILYVGDGTTAVSLTSFSHKLYPNDEYICDDHTAQIRGIWDVAGSGNARVTEVA